MTTTKRWMGGLLLGLMSIGWTFVASAAGYLHCPDPSRPDHCYPIYLEEVRFPIDPDPGPYQQIDISSIATDIKRSLGVSAEPDPVPWLMLDMANKKMVVLDLANQHAYVPEPGQLAMIASGMGGLALMARRRRA